MWQKRPFESYVESILKDKLNADGEKLWNQYVRTRDEVVRNVLPWIGSQEPNLTDHGVDHIADVIDNAALLLGFPNHFGNENTWTDVNGFSPQEFLVMISGLLMHDIGNIFGRNRHNQAIPNVWMSNKSAWNSWTPQQRSLISDIGRAHSGKTISGDKDTLEPLSTTPRYFDKVPIRAGDIAAVIRFADELAEGPQRTSKFLIENKLISQDSLIFHHYAAITQISIDRKRGCVAITYDIDLENPDYPEEKGLKRQFITDLLKLTYSRAEKLNYERQFARHYAGCLSSFRDTSVSLRIHRNDEEIGVILKPIILNDITALKNSNYKIENAFSEYEIEPLIQRINL